MTIGSEYNDYNGTIVDSYQMSIVLEVLSNRMQGVDSHLISEAYYVLGNHD